MTKLKVIDQHESCLQSVSEETLQEALRLLPQLMRPSLSDAILAAINEQATIIASMKRTSHARRLAFEAAMSSKSHELVEAANQALGALKALGAENGYAAVALRAALQIKEES